MSDYAKNPITADEALARTINSSHSERIKMYIDIIDDGIREASSAGLSQLNVTSLLMHQLGVMKFPTAVQRSAICTYYRSEPQNFDVTRDSSGHILIEWPSSK